MKEKLTQAYNKNYKLFLVIPAIILLISLIIIGSTYVRTGDFIHRDVSLTGGTTIKVSTSVLAADVQKALSGQFPNIEVRSLSDNAGRQIQLSIITSEPIETIRPVLENYLGFKLTDQNSSIEFTGSSLSKDFYTQLIMAIAIAFFWMAAVVFVIFAPKWKTKILAVFLNLLFGFFLGMLFLKLNIYLSVAILLVFAAGLIYIYIKNSIPSFAVMFCAFADITMTLAVVDIVNMKISAAGIVAFLMLIGYSVDTDILLTTRVLKRRGTSVNSEILSAFKTGMTMTLTAIASVAVALFFVYSFQTSLNQIFIILLIGLFFDMLNTWVTNTTLIKWFIEAKEGQ